MIQAPVTIITPCYNENVTAIRFLEALENTLENMPWSFYVVVVNDCSTDNTLSLLKGFQFKSANLVLKIINLKFNAGHQAAIYQGMLYAIGLESSQFIIMDADGEDSPAVIPALLTYSDTDIVNVVRSNRKESVLFKACYGVYKFIFRLLTRKQMNYGNFCLISRPVMERAVSSAFSHFAAFLSKQKYTNRYIVAEKGNRLGGKSKMGFKKLFRHAARSFAEYGINIPFATGHNTHLKTPIYEVCSGNYAEESV